MATIKTNSSIERSSYDYISAYAHTQSNNTTIVNELIDAYTLISKNLGLSGYQFIQTLENQGSDSQQAIYLAAQLNNIRTRNALLGVMSQNTTPLFISREISA
jgi:hypothetical protein